VVCMRRIRDSRLRGRRRAAFACRRCVVSHGAEG
jgi:hypothetical protein